MNFMYLSALSADCTLCYLKTIAIGRHLQNVHRTVNNSNGNVCIYKYSSSQYPLAELFDTEGSAEYSDPSVDVMNNTFIEINVAYEVKRSMPLPTLCLMIFRSYQNR